ncbi:hypothetical protein AB4077_20240 [Vibrio cyclitrophicus]|uniref:Lipoprotein n=1 Tax=Vibrio cyclitrophicus ZF270 TaxID=1136176 RepID=A0AAN0LIW0_9VIBR|nr:MULTISPECIES: hypothetical protein [Vibrio]KNH12780.1 hypothetical protein ACS79_10975 [Vibrio lentus]MBY7660213.1 hypothetical protein [Vibrio atlanticus]KAA8597436.1 hypothetical protein F0Z19_4124 [Vibrio cyclitrophicus]MBE8555015.1 hypothetical protein [Vibrio sp. OPT24]MBE8605943.1 hypothetical protein [Vibrio sp. OPT10]|tara:strand:- start:1211 stop:1621 length:411 start_codon:yes stop_codon:yes gene_type:complete
MKKLLLSTIALIMVAGCQSTPVQNEETTIADVLKASVNAINKIAPQMVDSETRIDSSYAVENKLVYKYTLINYSVDDFDTEKVQEIITKQVTGFVCTSPGMEYFVDNAIDISYHYYDKDSKYITEANVKTADCSKI